MAFMRSKPYVFGRVYDQLNVLVAYNHKPLRSLA
jgi:hypothetical protein